MQNRKMLKKRQQGFILMTRPLENFFLVLKWFDWFDQYFCRQPSTIEPLTPKQLHLCFTSITHRLPYILGLNTYRSTRTSCFSQLCIEFQPLSVSSLEMLYPTMHVYIGRVLLREVSQNSMQEILRYFGITTVKKYNLCVNLGRLSKFPYQMLADSFSPLFFFKKMSRIYFIQTSSNR